MNAYMTYLMFKEFARCPNCYEQHFGNGKGQLIIDTNLFHRTCDCGFEVKMNREEAIEFLKARGEEEL